MCLGKRLGLIGLALVLAACGGGGGNAGSNPNIPADPVVSAVVKTASLALTLASVDEMGAVGRIEVLQAQASKWAKLSELTPAAGDKLQAPMRTLQIVGGRKEKIRPGDVLGAMTGEAGFSADQIGKINVNEFSTYVAINRGIAAQALERLSQGRIKGKSVKVRALD